MKNKYQLVDDDAVFELVRDLKGEGWYVSIGYHLPANANTTEPQWNCKFTDPSNTKESFSCVTNDIVIPIAERTKFKVMSPEEFAEYQLIFGSVE